MKFPREKTSGTLFIIAFAQFLICIIIAEATYEGYSIHANYVSDLGIGSSSIVFNSSVFFLGLLIFLGAYFLKNSPNRTLRIPLFLMAFSAMGVGIFTKDFTLAHAAVSSAAFFFGGLSAIASVFVLKKPLSWISVILGLMTLGALALFSIGIVMSGSMTSTVAYDSPFYLGLGPGGMERMIIYPAIVWLALFGSQLVQQKS
ncbi:MAG: DUF998 domain-containing protein [Candidatus Bathyarchaeia archaeon]|jgi:hypothetical membrane protein